MLKYARHRTNKSISEELDTERELMAKVENYNMWHFARGSGVLVIYKQQFGDLVQGLREVLCAIICPLIFTLDPCRGHIGD